MRALILSFYLLLLTPWAAQGAITPFSCAQAPLDTTLFLETIDQHILSLREHNIPKAYYAFTSQEFQKMTSFDEFQRIVNKYSCLGKNKSIELDAIQFSEEIAHYRGLLTSEENQQLVVEYTMKLEHGYWKIHGFKLREILCNEK